MPLIDAEQRVQAAQLVQANPDALTRLTPGQTPSSLFGIDPATNCIAPAALEAKLG